MTQNLNSIFEEILGEDEFARPKFNEFLGGGSGFSSNKQNFFSGKFNNLFESFQLDLTRKLAGLDQQSPYFDDQARQVGKTNTFESFFKGFDFNNAFAAADPLSAGRGVGRFTPSSSFVFR
jgi:hypothetical protein